MPGRAYFTTKLWTSGRQSLLTTNSASAEMGGEELLLAPAAVAIDAAGAVLVADRATLGEFGPGLVVRVDRDTGVQAVLTSSAITGIRPGDQALTTPTGAAFERGGTLLVSERFGPSESSDDGALVRVDPTSGRQRTVGSRGIARRVGGPNLLNSPRGVALARDGSAVVVNAGSENFTRLHVVRVDPRTGRQSLIATNARSRRAGTPALFLEPAGVAVAPGGTIFVVDVAAFGGSGGVVAVDPATGRQTAVTSNRISLQAGGQEPFSEPNSLALDGRGGLFVTDRERHSVIRVDLSSGRAARFSTNRISRRRGGSAVLANPRGVALTRGGDLIVADRALEGLIRIDGRTGRQKRVYGRRTSAQRFFVRPSGVVIEPWVRRAGRSGAGPGSVRARRR